MRSTAWKQDIATSKDWAMEKMYEAESEFYEACESNDSQAAQTAWASYWHYRKLWMGV